MFTNRRAQGTRIGESHEPSMDCSIRNLLVLQPCLFVLVAIPLTSYPVPSLLPLAFKSTGVDVSNTRTLSVPLIQPPSCRLSAILVVSDKAQS